MGYIERNVFKEDAYEKYLKSLSNRNRCRQIIGSGLAEDYTSFFYTRPGVRILGDSDMQILLPSPHCSIFAAIREAIEKLDITSLITAQTEKR